MRRGAPCSTARATRAAGSTSWFSGRSSCHWRRRTAASAVDLNPPGFTYSSAQAISGGSQVGDGHGPSTGFSNHALLWKGTAASAVDLNPPGFNYSQARGVSGESQVGWGTLTGTLGARALLWSGTAASFVDLHPANFEITSARGVAGLHQVGEGYGPATGGATHALMWSGTVASTHRLVVPSMSS